MKKKWFVSTAAVVGLLAIPTVAMAAPTSSTPHKTSSIRNANVSYPYPGHLIEYGSTGIYVKEIQQRLNQLPDSNAGEVDGIFGPKTLIAVKLFQRSHGLTVDGIVGPQTWNALFNNNSEGGSPSGFHHPDHWYENSVLRQGDSGTQVRNLQYILNVMQFYTKTGLVNVDGIFGPQTAQAVKTYQEGNGLTPDGIVGPKTWASFSKYISRVNTSTYQAGSYMGLRIEWKYDNTSDTSDSIAYIYGDGDHLTDHYTLNG